MNKPRFRDYGFSVGEMPTGPMNSIHDVRGVKVGHVTLDSGHGFSQAVCTGVTAILPHEGNVWRNKVVATSHVINGFGKTTGLVQVEELGEIESPILLTNTFGVPAVTEGALQHMMKENPDIGDSSGSLNVVVGECNDSFLNDMRGLHVRPSHAALAIRNAQTSTVVEEGAVGAGTGMRCFGWKGGIGSASRQITVCRQPFTFGLLVLTNFGVPEDLTILGRRVGSCFRPGEVPPEVQLPDGSIMLVLATDLPMNPLSLKRVAKRTAFGLAHTGSIAHHGSGDIVIAFSTAQYPSSEEIHPLYVQQALNDGAVISECFRAVVEATEEAILNSLCAATNTTGRSGRFVPALPMSEVAGWLHSFDTMNSLNLDNSL